MVNFMYVVSKLRKAVKRVGVNQELFGFISKCFITLREFMWRMIKWGMTKKGGRG